MGIASAPHNTALKPDTGTTPPPLIGAWLTIIRILWAAFAIGLVALYALSIPARFAQLVALAERLTQPLPQLNITPRTFAAYISILDTITLGTCLTIAIILFLRKSDDWITIFISFMLALFGLVVVRDPGAYEVAAPP